MKKIMIAVLLAAVLSTSLFIFVHAEKSCFEECYHCQMTGEYRCAECGNTGEVVCDGCHGEGGSVCQGDGEHGCDHGYYTCPACHGDGLMRTGDGGIAPDAQPGSCGYYGCNGTGKIECWTCHGTGWNPCTRCDGKGIVECQHEDCKKAKAVGYKCPYCLGTGYLTRALDGDWDKVINDGVTNVPKKGDEVQKLDGSLVIYGEGPKETETVDDEARDPATGRDYVWFIDVGSGEWELDGQTAAAYRNGERVTGVTDVKYYEPINIGGIEGRRGVHAYLRGDNNFSVELEFNGGGDVCVGRRIAATGPVPFNVSLVLEYHPEDTDNPEDPGKRKFNVDFGAGSYAVDGYDAPVIAQIDGEQATGVFELEEHTVIALDNFDGVKMRARVYADDGFSVNLSPNGKNEVSLGRLEDESAFLPGELHFTVERSGDDGPDQPEGPEKREFNVDFGAGSYAIDGYDAPVVAQIDGAQAKGVLEIEEYTVIKLDNFDSANMRARVYADDGFSACLSPNGENEVSLGRLEDESAFLPGELHFTVEKRENDVPEEIKVLIDKEKMTPEEAEALSRHTEEELAGYAETVKRIMSTAEPASTDKALNEKLAGIAAQNGVTNGKDVQLLPIRFDGHIELDFPVKVTVELEPGVLNGGKPIYMYHICEDGDVEPLGAAELTCRDDGSVQTLSFYTKSFSDFFASDKELTLGADGAEETQNEPNKTENTFPFYVIIIIAAVVIAAAVAVVTVTVKKKKS